MVFQSVLGWNEKVEGTTVGLLNHQNAPAAMAKLVIKTAHCRLYKAMLHSHSGND